MNLKKRCEYDSEEEKEKINWANIEYTALKMGLSRNEFKKLNPILFYEMVETHIELERKKYGK